MRTINRRRIVSSAMCVLMIASLSVPTSIQGAEITREYEVREVDKVQLNEYVIEDSSYNLDVYLLQNLGATTIKLANDNVTVSQNGEITVFPKYITQFIGWKPAGFGQPEEEKMRMLGSGGGNQTLQFEKGSNTVCKNITFETGVHVVIPEETIVTFENCIFKSGKIENNGTVYYRSMLEKPVNVGTTQEKPIVSNPMEDETLNSGEIKYKKMMILNTGSISEDLLSFKGLYSGVKFGLLPGISTELGNTVVPKSIREVVGWDFGVKGWGDYGIDLRKIGEGNKKQSFTFEENSNTKINHLDFQEKVKVLVPAKTNIHFINTIFRGQIEVEQGGTATFEECQFLNSKEHESGVIEGNGKVEYINMQVEPQKLDEIGEIEYKRMIISNNLKQDIEACGDLYTGIKIGLIKEYSTNIYNTILPKSIRDFVGWNFGVKGWGDYGAEIRKIGEGGTKQSLSFARGSNTKVRMIEFQENVDVTVPAYTTVRFENVIFKGKIEIEQDGVAQFVDCIFDNSQQYSEGIIYNAGEVSWLSTTKEPHQIVGTLEGDGGDSGEAVDIEQEIEATKENVQEVAKVLIDNYQDLNVQLQGIDEKVNTIKIANGNITICKANETLILSEKIKKLMGWQEKTYLSNEGDKLQTLGSGGKEQTITFENNSRILVKNIRFVDGVEVIVPKTVTVLFENCIFDKILTNNGTAVFDHCTFTTSKIINNGVAEYLNQTSKPLNLGKESVLVGKIPLGITLIKDRLKDGVVGVEYAEEIEYELLGTAKNVATVTVDILEKQSGLMAKIEDGKVKLSGVPKEAMTVHIKVIANADREVPVEKLLEIEILASLQAESSNSLTVDKSNTNTGNVAIPEQVETSTTNSHTTVSISVPVEQEKKGENSTGTTIESSMVTNEQKNGQEKKENRRKKQNKSIPKSIKKVRSEAKNKNKKKLISRYYKKMTGISFVQVLKKLKVNSSFSFRKRIAEVNGIKGYTGTEVQNKKLLVLVKKGKLKKPMGSSRKEHKLEKK